MNQKVQQPTSKAKKHASETLGREGFFVIPKNTWDELYRKCLRLHHLSINNMVAYLALACGTGADHKTTSWSAGAIYRHTGLSLRAANTAIEQLRKEGFIEVVKAAQKSVLPVYKLKYTYNPKIDRNNHNIYIPSGVVVGVANEDSPLKRLLNTQHITLLYLFILLYAHQDKFLDIIDPNLISSALHGTYTALNRCYDESNKLCIWEQSACFDMSGNPADNVVSFNSNPFFNFNSNQDRFEDLEAIFNTGQRSEQWRFIGILESLGLVKPTGYICRGEKSELSNLDPLLEVDSDFHTKVIGCLEILADAQSKGEAVKAAFAGWTGEYAYVMPAKYKSLHLHNFYKMTYRTKEGAAKTGYLAKIDLSNEIIKSVNQMLEKYSK